MALRAIYKQHHLQSKPKNEDEKESSDELPKGDIKMSKKTKMGQTVTVIFILLVAFGIGTGFLLARSGKSTASKGATTTTVSSNGKTAIGSTDSTTFKDSAEGTLQKGGISGDGTHNLVRDGGPSQTVYLISSVVDLDQFIGKKVKVWGQTIAAQKAAWLMDVGKVEIE